MRGGMWCVLIPSSACRDMWGVRWERVGLQKPLSWIQEFLYTKKETLTCSKLLRTNVYFGVNCRPVSHPSPGLLELHWNWGVQRCLFLWCVLGATELCCCSGNRLNSCLSPVNSATAGMLSSVAPCPSTSLRDSISVWLCSQALSELQVLSTNSTCTKSCLYRFTTAQLLAASCLTVDHFPSQVRSHLSCF